MTEQRNLATQRVPGTAQAGQAMVFTLLFAGAAGLIALLLFNSGMLANAKTRLHNAADAGAYSAGVLQARDHNFVAYTNRAMVANQVAVVQLASLKSYLEDAAKTHDRLDEGIVGTEYDWFPEDTPLWDYAIDLPVQSANDIYQAVAGPAVTGLDQLINVFMEAQSAHQLATVLSMVAVVDEVVHKNDPNAAVSKSLFLFDKTWVQISDWRDTTTRHRANDDSVAADRFADVVVSEQSTDRFTRNRSANPIAAWGPFTENKVCKALGVFHVSSSTGFGFFHRGGSQLSQDKKRWLSLDATTGLGFQQCTFWYPCLPTGYCESGWITPLIDANMAKGDSGGALVGDGSGYDSKTGYKNNPSSTNDFGDAFKLPTTWAANDRYSDGPGSSLDTAGGLQKYYRDVSNPDTEIPANQSAAENDGKVAVTIEVERRGSSIRTSGKLLPDAAALKLEDKMSSDSLRVIASANTFFYRSKTNTGFKRNGWARADGKTEVANLFSPYWQTHLVDRTAQDRATSWLSQQ